MPRLRSLEGGGDGLQVSHLTDQDDLGGLAEDILNLVEIGE